ncbi:hypothetical protein BSKO_13914 [Bryopsis sp. KO-2023]|nr:hypothetical protein BSKO_13914 [Bryopsis sp. KO-2023]
MAARVTGSVFLGSRHVLRAPVAPSQRLNRRSATTRAMAGKEIVFTDKAPAALGPYSQAVKANGMLFVSGQLGLIPGSKELSPDVSAQAEQVLKNVGAVLEAGGSSYDKVVKTTVLLADMADFVPVNKVYATYFPENPPARAAFAVKTLPLNALVEIEAVAIAE